MALFVGLCLVAQLRPASCRLHQVKQAGPRPGQQHGPQGRLLARQQRLHGHAKDIGDDLPPQAASGPAAGQDDALRAAAQLCQHLVRVVGGKGHALLHGSYKVALAVAQGEPKEGAARVGVHVRRALAHQVREKEQALRPWRRVGGGQVHHVVGVRVMPAEHAVAQPAQGHAGAERRSHLVPAGAAIARLQSAAKGVDAPATVDLHLTHRLHKLAARADAEQQPVGGQRAGPQGTACSVGGPGDDGDSGEQSQVGGGKGLEHTGDGGGRLHGRQQAAVNAENSQQFVRPVAAALIQQQRPGAIRGVGGEGAGQPPAHIVLGQQQHSDLCPHLRRFLLEPAGSGGQEASRERAAGDAVEPLGAHRLRDLLHLAPAALVGPDHRWGERVAGGVEQDCAVHLAGKTDGCDLPCAGGGDAAHGGDDGLPPRLGLLLGALGLWLKDGIFDAGSGDHAAAAIGQQHLDRGSAQVDAKQVRRGHRMLSLLVGRVRTRHGRQYS